MAPKKRKAPPIESVGRANKMKKELISIAPEEPQEPEESTSKSQAFPFLNLPPELRQMVYKAFFDLRSPRRDGDEKFTTMCPSDCPRNNDATSLRLVSRQILSESWPLFTECHTFSIKLDQLDNFLAAIRFENRSPISHLTIWAPNWQRAEYRLEPIWWTYLDTLSRLKTITLEAYNRLSVVPSKSVSGFLFWSLKLLPFLNSLLKQEANRRSDWTEPNQALESMIPAPQDTLPPSYDFELSLVQKQHNHKRETCPGGWMVEYYSRYVIRQGLDPEYMSSTEEFCKWRRDKGLAISPPDSFGNVKHVRLAEYDELQSLVPANLSDYKLDNKLFNYHHFHWDAEDFLRERIDGFCTMYAERGDACVTVGVGFIGRWINDNDQ